MDLWTDAGGRLARMRALSKDPIGEAAAHRSGDAFVCPRFLRVAGEGELSVFAKPPEGVELVFVECRIVFGARLGVDIEDTSNACCGVSDLGLAGGIIPDHKSGHVFYPVHASPIVK